MAKEITLFLTLVLALGFAQDKTSNGRPRASDIGLKVGILPVGPLNGITDVAGVAVGQTTVIRGDNVQTGVTAVLPHAGNLYVKIPYFL
jgi:D-aminopeptidase